MLNTQGESVSKNRRVTIICYFHQRPCDQAALVTDFLREHELAPPDYPMRKWWEDKKEARAPLPRALGLRRAPAVMPGAAGEQLKISATIMYIEGLQ